MYMYATDPRAERGAFRTIACWIAALWLGSILWPGLLQAAASQRPINVTADRLISQNESQYAEFIGNVKASQDNFVIQSQRLRIYYEGNPQATGGLPGGDRGSIKKIVASGDVRIQADDRTAVTQKAEYTVADQVLVLSGENSKILSDQNTVVGSRITFYRAEKRVQVEGRPSQPVHALVYSQPETPGRKGVRMKRSGAEEAAGAQQPTSPPPSEAKPAAPQFLKPGSADRTRTPETAVGPAASPVTEATGRVPAAGPEPGSGTASRQAPADAPANGSADQPDLLASAASAAETDAPERKTTPRAYVNPVVLEPPGSPAASGPASADPPPETRLQSAASPDLTHGEPAEKVRRTPEAAPRAAAPEMAAAPAAGAEADPSARVMPVAEIPAGELRPRAAMAPFENRSGFPDPDFEAGFQAQLATGLAERCDKVDFSRPGDPGYPPFMSALPKRPSGRFDNFQIAYMAARNGVNAVVVPVLYDIISVERERKILWMKWYYQRIRIRAGVIVFDTDTGSKLMDRDFIEEVPADEFAEAMGGKAVVNISQLAERFAEISEDMIKSVCRVLAKKSWSGYVIARNGDEVVIAPGAAAGLSRGNVLEVFGRREIEGAQEQRFYLPGDKAGELLVTAVNADHATARIVSDAGIEAGGTLKPKKQ